MPTLTSPLVAPSGVGSVILPPYGPLATDGTVSSNTLYVSEIWVKAACPITGIQAFKGSVISGNLEVALYNAAGTTLLGSSVSTAMSAGTFMWQLVPFSAGYQASPGKYLISAIMDTGVAKYMQNYPASPTSWVFPGSFTIPSSITPPSASGRVNEFPTIGTY